MADLGDLLGSLMIGLIRARRMADEQTAVLAEYYRDNPLLEGLSVPRIRIPELTIDMPFIIENHASGENAIMEEPRKIVEAVLSRTKSTLSKYDIKIAHVDFMEIFARNMQGNLDVIKQSTTSLMKETVVQSVQSALADTLVMTKTSLTGLQKEVLAKDIRETLSTIGIIRPQVMPSIVANIKSADVKERATPTSVVRLKVTLKEEGLEWTTQASESGGVVHTLQPE